MRGFAPLAIAVLLLGATSTARAQPATERSSDVGLRVYVDDDHVTVWSPSATVEAPVRDDLVVDASTTIDVVTAASIDVVSSASPLPVQEQRVEAGLGARYAVTERNWLGARAVFSDEHDYTSLHVEGSWLTERAQQNTTLKLTYTGAFDTVGRYGDPMFARDRRSHRLVASLTQVTDKRGYLDVVVDADRSTGYLANPYRYVPIAMGGAIAYELPEQVPDARTSLAALVRIRRAVGARWFAHADYRLYRDTWGITSHTVSARAIATLLDDRLEIGAEARGYLQGAASFHRARYAGDAGAPVWRTADRSLGAMRSISLGAIAELTLPWRDLHVTASLAWVEFRWLDDLLQRRRDAAITSLAVHVPF